MFISNYYLQEPLFNNQLCVYQCDIIVSIQLLAERGEKNIRQKLSCSMSDDIFQVSMAVDRSMVPKGLFLMLMKYLPPA